MEKRVLIAVILSFVVLYAYQAIFPPPKPVDLKSSSTTSSAPVFPAQSAAASTAAQPPAENPSQQGQAEAATSAAPLVADTIERDVTVENAAVTAVFTTRGGALKSWRLKKYQDAAGQALELVPHSVPEGTTRPFTLSVADPAASATLGRALFKPSANQISV